MNIESFEHSLLEYINSTDEPEDIIVQKLNLIISIVDEILYNIDNGRYLETEDSFESSWE